MLMFNTQQILWFLMYPVKEGVQCITGWKQASHKPPEDLVAGVVFVLPDAVFQQGGIAGNLLDQPLSSVKFLKGQMHKGVAALAPCSVMVAGVQDREVREIVFQGQREWHARDLQLFDDMIYLTIGKFNLARLKSLKSQCV